MYRRHLISVLLLAIVSFDAAVAQEMRREPIIDVHMHAFPARLNPDGTPEPILCVNDRVPCDNPRSVYTTDDAVLEGVLTMMDEYNIVLGVLSSGRRQQAWLQVAPERFLVGVTPNFRAGTPPSDSLRVLFEAGRFHVIGEMGPPYSGLSPTDSIYAPYFALAEELDIPILIHAGIGARVPAYRVEMGRPVLLEPVLGRHPALRMYVENAGYPFIDEMIAMLYMYPNLYVDVSTITWPSLPSRPLKYRHRDGALASGWID
jgi:uncharacterized protein